MEGVSWLAKRLAVLFLIFAIIIVLIVGVFANVWWFTIIKRMIFAGLIFMILGIIIGEYLHYNLKSVNGSKSARDSVDTKTERKQQTDNQVEATDNIEDDSDEMMPLDFEEVDSNQDNVINQKINDVNNLEELNELGEEIDSQKVTDILRNMTENN